MVSNDSVSSLTSMPRMVRSAAPMMSLSITRLSRREAEQARHHAGRLVDQVGPGIADQRVVVGLLRPRLRVRHLAVGHAGGGAAGEVVVLRDLPARRRQQRLFRAAAGHRAGAQVGDERPQPEDRRMPRHDGVDIDQPGQHLRDFLRQRPGQRRRRGGPGLAGRQQQHRHAAAHREFEVAAGVGGELHRRHDEAVGLRHERPRPPRRLRPGDGVQHREAAFAVAPAPPSSCRHAWSCRRPRRSRC